MRRFIGLLIVGAVLSLGQEANAGPYEDGNAAYERGDYATALNMHRPLAEHGDMRAQFALGFMYSWGMGVARNDQEAAKWYGLAAGQGFAGAQYALGLMYRAGAVGVPRDYQVAERWLR